MSPSPELASVLAGVDAWGADNVAVATVRLDGSTFHGPVDRVLPLASVTKLLTSYGCLIAVEEGTLDLDEPAGEPDGCTVRHLLAHAGGYGFDGGPLTPPGRKRIYSNTGFEALADHLAKLSGMDAADYVTAAVVEPLGMASTTIAGSLAHGATSTVTDLARFTRELLDPTLLAAETLAAATTVQFPGLDGVLPGFGTQTPNDWGLGFELRDHKSPHWTGSTNSTRTFGHFGAAGTFLWVDPDFEVALVVLTDRPFGEWATLAWPPFADQVLAAAVTGNR
ncbi:MAG: beta-lactamase family protein [Acidimicrobiales bacterium]|nr:beta-lactamase family protein [Acidimicrobiales bacterium]